MSDLNTLTLEGLGDRVADSDKIKAWRKRTVTNLDNIDTTFENIEAGKVKYASESVVVEELDALIEELKLAMYAIYTAH